MNATATASNVSTEQQRQIHAPSFSKVLDGRKQPIRGLWVRNGRFYAQLTFEDSKTEKKTVRRVPLMDKDKQPVQTVPQAIEAFNRLKVNRSDSNLPVLHRYPKFSDYVKTYLEYIRAGQGSGENRRRGDCRQRHCRQN